MSAKKHTESRCDSCNHKITARQHELVLSDPETGQVIGNYHAPQCQAAAVKYFTAGVVLSGTYLHPDRCGPDQMYCDSGLSEWAA